MIDVARAIARLHELHPGVRIDVRSAATGGSIGLLADVASGATDLCIVVLPIAVPPEIELQPLVSGGYTAAVGVTHPFAARTDALSPEDFEGADLVEFPVGFSIRNAADRIFAEHGIRRRTHIEVGHLELIATYVAAGLGIGLISRDLVAARPDLVALDAPWLELRWTVAIARRRDRRVSRAAATLIAELEENCRQGIAAGRFDAPDAVAR